MAQKNVVDPWTLNADGTPDPFANVNWNMPDLPDLDEDQPPVDLVTLDDHDGLQPEVVVVEGGVVKQPPVPVVPEPVIPADPEEPETLDLEDGTQLILQKDKGWWVGSVVGQAGSAQVYKGATKNKLILEVLKAQANATKKIREQNTKLRRATTPAATPVATPAPNVRALTADEAFAIKEQLNENPDLALETWFQQKTGISVGNLVRLAQKGANADTSLIIQTVGAEFLQRNPDWYANPNNAEELVKWLAKYKLNKLDATDQELCEAGIWTVDNLEEAFEDLSSDNKLVKAPRQPKTHPPQVETPPPVAVQLQEPAPAPRPDSRIVSQVTRPRAALGLRPNDVTPVAEPTAPKAPSAEDLESLTDEQIAQLMRGVQRQKALNRRSN